MHERGGITQLDIYHLGWSRNSDTKLSTAISTPEFLKEPHNCARTIHRIYRNPVNGLMLILQFCG